MKNWDKILDDFARKCKGGAPDMTNPRHLALLRESLIKFGWKENAMNAFIGNLREGKEVIVEKRKPGEIWKTKSGWAGLKPGEKSAQYGMDSEETAQAYVSGQDGGEEKLRNISKENQRKVDDFRKRYENNKEFLSEEQQELMEDAIDKIEVIYDDDATEEEKKEAAEWLITNMKMSTNSNGKKAYFNALGGNRKIISGNAGTNNSADLVEQVSKHAEMKQYNARGVNQSLTTAAKPDLGKENEVKPRDKKGNVTNPKIEKFFQDHPILSRIRPGLWGIFGVRSRAEGDPEEGPFTGPIKMPSNEHANEYLQQSFNNPALQNTINVAREHAKEGNIDTGVVTALEKHQENLSKIKPPEYEIPSDEAADAIAKSYQDMMLDLHKADPDVASAIMKQLAENRLYEEELARGEEVYLPSNGTFPGGDKIKVDGTLERVTLVSCKWGKSGRTYGCPANAKAVTDLHPNPNKRNNQGQYIGEDGFTLLINDDLIRGKDKEETTQKTDDFMKNTLDEVGLGDVLSDDERREVATVVAEHMEAIDKIKKKLEGVTPAEKYWKLFDLALRGSPDDPPAVGKDGKPIPKKDRRPSLEEQSKRKMGKIMTPEKVAALVGENNVGNFLDRNGNVSPDAVMGMVEIANNIRTACDPEDSPAYGLSHNKQFYSDTGKPKSVTQEGSCNPDDYSITVRNHRTAGRSGGGIQLSYTGDGTPPETNVEDDGLRTNVETGTEIET